MKNTNAILNMIVNCVDVTSALHDHTGVSSTSLSLLAARLCFYFRATVSESFFSLFFSSRGNFS